MAKLWLLALISILGLVAVSSYLAWDEYQQSLQDRQKLVRSAVQTASGVLSWAHQLETSGKMARDQAQAMARLVIGQMR